MKQVYVLVVTGDEDEYGKPDIEIFSTLEKAKAAEKPYREDGFDTFIRSKSIK